MGTVFVCRAEDAVSADRCERQAVGRSDITLVHKNRRSHQHKNSRTTYSYTYDGIQGMNLCFVLPEGSESTKRSTATAVVPMMEHCATAQFGMFGSNHSFVHGKTVPQTPIPCAGQGCSILGGGPVASVGKSSVTLRFSNDPVLLAERMSGTDREGEIPGFGSTTLEEKMVALYLFVLAAMCFLVPVFDGAIPACEISPGPVEGDPTVNS